MFVSGKNFVGQDGLKWVQNEVFSSFMKNQCMKLFYFFLHEVTVA